MWWLGSVYEREWKEKKEETGAVVVVALGFEGSAFKWAIVEVKRNKNNSSVVEYVTRRATILRVSKLQLGNDQIVPN